MSAATRRRILDALTALARARTTPVSPVALARFAEKPLAESRALLTRANAPLSSAYPTFSTSVDTTVESANAPEAPSRLVMEPRAVVGLRDAVAWVKANAGAKFVESVELSVHLGVDPKRSDMIVRGAVKLPHGTGKTVRVAVFADGEAAEEARRAGATIVGGEELVNEIKEGGSGAISFDKAIGTPSMMPKLKEIARILGPRGLMPNPKLGTVTTDVTPVVKEMLGGRVEFRAEKNAIVHAMVGKVNFEDAHIEENIAAVFKEILALRPKGKGAPNASKYIKKAYLASTMGRGSARIELAELSAAAASLAD